MVKFPVYLDCHATTPVDPRVLEVMMSSLTFEFGNAASQSHVFGWKAQERVENARSQLARLIQCEPDEIIFTSGATESNNLAIKGVCEIYQEKGRHIISQVTEHKSVLDTLKYLEKRGFEVTYLPVNERGLVDAEKIKQSLRPDTILVSIMAANNEIGTIQPVRAIGKLCKENNVFYHVDAAQALGKIPVHVNPMGIDLMAVTAHKMYGPKGTGALYVRKKNPHVRISPLIHGGGHEKGLRSGTLNVAGISGFGTACEIAVMEMDKEAERISGLRNRLETQIKSRIELVKINGDPVNRLFNNLNVSFAGVDAESLLSALGSKVAVSSGSACMSGAAEPSHVLKALHLEDAWLSASIRFGIGRFNTEEEIDFAAELLEREVKKIRQASPVYEIIKSKMGPSRN